MSKRTRRSEVERLRSRSVLRQRKQTQLCHTNSRCSTRSATRRNQSNFEMGFMGMEQNCLHHGLSAGQRRHRSNSSRKEQKKQKSHRDIWRRIAAALHAKGLENHRVEKVKAHHEETLKQASARKRNEEADKRAVEAAARNAAPSQ